MQYLALFKEEKISIRDDIQDISWGSKQKQQWAATDSSISSILIYKKHKLFKMHYGKHRWKGASNIIESDLQKNRENHWKRKKITKNQSLNK